MSHVTFKGAAVPLTGTFPQTGEKSPSFALDCDDLSQTTLASLEGKKVVLNIFPSIDTATLQRAYARSNAKKQQSLRTRLLFVFLLTYRLLRVASAN